MDELLRSTAERAASYLASRDERPVFPSADAVAGLDRFDETLPDEATDPSHVIALLDDVGGPATTSSSGGRYFGFVTGGAQPAGIAASWMMSAWDQNAGVSAMSPVAAKLDDLAGRWLIDLFDLPSSSQVSFTSGTSTANVICLAAGRDAVLTRVGWDSANDGLIGAPELRVVVSEAAHASVTKALAVIGIGRRNVVTVPADDQGRMRGDSLPEAGPPTIVITQAGNVNSGSFDPFDQIARHFEGTPAWVHVDGAFGLWAAASPEHRHLVSGVDRCDSWATDMHKYLNTTYDSAVAIVRDPADLVRTFRVGADYLPDGERLEPLDRGIAMSQRARGIEAWAVLKASGRSGVADLIERTCRFARRFADELPTHGFEIHNDVVLNQVMVSLDVDERTNSLITAVERDGTLWAGGSIWNGRRVLRISVSGWETTDADITRSIQALAQLATTRG